MLFLSTVERAEVLQSSTMTKAERALGLLGLVELWESLRCPVSTCGARFGAAGAGMQLAPAVPTVAAVLLS